MKKYNEDVVNYWLMCSLRQFLVKLGNYANAILSFVMWIDFVYRKGKMKPEVFFCF